ncbi:MAG: hypothetical protein D6765_04860 [Bacteroidetes bacterium]|nr:MAG: hypothetical protein D6765_04860 [Bacteroidota bacterium]
MTQASLKEAIASGQLELALEQLGKILEWQNKDLQNQFFLLKAQWEDLGKQKRLGLLDSATAIQRNNQITFGLLELVDQFTYSEPAPQSAPAATGSEGDALRRRVAEALNCPPESLNSAALQARASDIAHQLKLFDIQSKNLQSAEEAAAKWGELAPPIVQHRLEEARNEIEAIKARLQELLS